MTEPARAPRQRSLRTSLTLAVTILLVVISVAIGAVATVAVRGSLLAEVDAQLATTSQGPGPRGDTGRAGDLDFLRLPGQGPGAIGAVNAGDGWLAGRVEPGRAGFEALPAADVEVLARVPADGRAHSIDLPESGSYRAMASDHSGTLLVRALPLDTVNAAVGRTLLITGLAVVLGAALAVLAAAGIIARLLAPLRRVAATAGRVAELPLDKGSGAVSERVDADLTDPGTEVGQVGLAVNHMLDNVESSLRARHRSESQVRQFVADAGHELRTPLAAIRGYADLTRPRRADTDPQVVHSLERIDAGAVRMSALVEELLMLARMDAGRDLEPVSDVDATAAILEIIGDAHAAGPGHNYRLELPEDPVWVRATPTGLGHVLSNLVTNARVHTPEGSTVTVGARLEGHRVLLTVSDDGPGIPDGLEVFERFVRGDTARTRESQTGSSGLGLAIVATLTEAMGGTIAFESRPGHTVFTLGLDAVASAEPGAAGEPGPIPR